jgi:hypothetical protein
MGSQHHIYELSVGSWIHSPAHGHVAPLRTLGVKVWCSPASTSNVVYLSLVLNRVEHFAHPRCIVPVLTEKLWKRDPILPARDPELQGWGGLESSLCGSNIDHGKITCAHEQVRKREDQKERGGVKRKDTSREHISGALGRRRGLACVLRSHTCGGKKAEQGLWCV